MPLDMCSGDNSLQITSNSGVIQMLTTGNFDPPLYFSKLPRLLEPVRLIKCKKNQNAWPEFSCVRLLNCCLFCRLISSSSLTALVEEIAFILGKRESAVLTVGWQRC